MGPSFWVHASPLPAVLTSSWCCGCVQGNLHGILVGRENLPDGILYASKETHYSVFKAARMYRMDSVKVRRLTSWLQRLAAVC